MKIAEVIDEILFTVTPKRRKSTQLYHMIYFNELKSEIGSHDIDGFDLKAFTLWINGFKKRKERKTFDDYTKFVNIVFNYAYNNKLIAFNIKFPRVDEDKERAGRVYSSKEISALWKNMDSELQIQFAICFECFMRLREMLHLTWDRVDLGKSIIILRKQDVKTGSRTNQGRTIPMSPMVHDLLSDRLEMSKSEFVFPSQVKNKPINCVKKKWARVKRGAGIRGRARWHDIRHTALTMAVMEKKVPLAHLSKVAGVSIRTLERVYLHAHVEHLREVTCALKILEIA